jgi:hypothetical protein
MLMGQNIDDTTEFSAKRVNHIINTYLFMLTKYAFTMKYMSR